MAGRRSLEKFGFNLKELPLPQQTKADETIRICTLMKHSSQLRGKGQSHPLARSGNLHAEGRSSEREKFFKMLEMEAMVR